MTRRRFPLQQQQPCKGYLSAVVVPESARKSPRSSPGKRQEARGKKTPALQSSIRTNARKCLPANLYKKLFKTSKKWLRKKNRQRTYCKSAVRGALQCDFGKQVEILISIPTSLTSFQLQYYIRGWGYLGIPELLSTSATWSLLKPDFFSERRSEAASWSEMKEASWLLSTASHCGVPGWAALPVTGLRSLTDRLVDTSSTKNTRKRKPWFIYGKRKWSLAQKQRNIQTNQPTIVIFPVGKIWLLLMSDFACLFIVFL